MKNLGLALCCLILACVSCTSSNKKTEEKKDSTENTQIPSAETQQITETITRFTRAYISQDNQKANALIHPDLGLYVIYRPGAADTYERVDSIDFQKPLPTHFPYTTFENEYVLRFDKLPVYDCGGEKWDKLGFFCDTTEQAIQLTRIAEFRQEFGEVGDDELKTITEIEKDSFRVILTKNENLIFHVKKYNGAWYVTVLDRAYGWCDA
ncbi:hypothetical protein BC792_11826 [Sphingobacterium allocomposti]|jgi:hypothetical protein|uniref:Uncharacterized protein n=1 Tax=Sphingobacterium allocomposti TaxID=415956 RepID=A0A5S5D710_9SPHI|nr:hypothetical protein [Sphingobacterium composti Yoo et al. 2007 non Ten et al. 2007]TYP91780.1 hypothetical protein BC792_11826 [Sphingobacterium composti Yoo et al. 2007 non Ten et al. 2007]HLS93922.1 hypothetical protein [Sphingobacterium sp.]